MQGIIILSTILFLSTLVIVDTSFINPSYAVFIFVPVFFIFLIVSRKKMISDSKSRILLEEEKIKKEIKLKKIQEELELKKEEERKLNLKNQKIIDEEIRQAKIKKIKLAEELELYNAILKEKEIEEKKANKEKKIKDLKKLSLKQLKEKKQELEKENQKLEKSNSKSLIKFLGINISAIEKEQLIKIANFYNNFETGLISLDNFENKANLDDFKSKVSLVFVEIVDLVYIDFKTLADEANLMKNAPIGLILSELVNLSYIQEEKLIRVQSELKELKEAADLLDLSDDLKNSLNVLVGI